MSETCFLLYAFLLTVDSALNHHLGREVLVRHRVELDMDDRNGQSIPCCFKSMSYFINHINRERCGGPVSQHSTTRCFQWKSDLEMVQAKAAIEYLAYRERLEHNMQHVVLRYFVVRWCLASLNDGAQPLDIRRQKCTNLCYQSNYRQSKLEMCALCTKWLPKP